MKTYLHSFFYYIIHPQYSKPGKIKFSCRRILFFGAILITGGLFLSLLQEIPIVQAYFTVKVNIVSESIQSHGIFISLIVIGLAGPYIEEFIFRYFLNSRQCYSTLCLVHVAVLINYLSDPPFWLMTSFLVIAFLVNYVISIRLKERYSFKRMMYLRFKGKFWIVYYSGALAFGILHISNLEMLHKTSPFILILVLPQIYAGVILGFVRMKWGMRESICLHMLNNIFAVLGFAIFHHTGK